MTDTRQTHAQAELRTDIPRGSWIDRWLPAAARPYARLMRLDRPIGTWLLLFPCWWGLALATRLTAQHVPRDSFHGAYYWASVGYSSDSDHLVTRAFLFAIGALVMRGAGCTYNDIIDRDFDAKVARTALRPIPSGDVSVRAAIIFLLAQLLVGLVILLQFNRFTVWLGVASLALIFTYPLMKRFTYWPQAFLGLTFNWGILMGWAAVFGNLDWAALLLYAGGIAWTLHYDTIYAHQDKEDDALIGVKSTALRFGDSTEPALLLFSCAAAIFFGASFILHNVHWIALIGVAAVLVHLGWQIRSVDLNNPADCLAKFHSNRWIGWIMLVSILIGNAVLGTGVSLE